MIESNLDYWTKLYFSCYFNKGGVQLGVVVCVMVGHVLMRTARDIVGIVVVLRAADVGVVGRQ